MFYFVFFLNKVCITFYPHFKKDNNNNNIIYIYILLYNIPDNYHRLVERIMTSKKKLLDVLNGNSRKPPPIWLMRQAGRHLKEYLELRATASSFLDFCYSPDLCAEATLQPIRKYQMDAAILFSDILVVPDALGQKVEFIPGKGPCLEAIKTATQIDKLEMEGFRDRLAPVYEAIKAITKELSTFSNNPALIGFAGSPWTVATYMVEGGSSKNFEIVRKWLYTNQAEFEKLINILVISTTEHLMEQIKSGVETIQLFDSWAGVLTPAQFEKWVIKPTSEIVKNIKLDFPNIRIIGFPKGAGILYKNYVDNIDIDCVSIDSTVPLVWVADNLQKRCAVQGNLDNMMLLTGGLNMETEIRNILRHLSNGPLVFNLGHGVLPETPVKNVEKLIETIHGFYND